MEFNEVAWFFYWADIIPNIGTTAAVFAFFMLFVFGAFIVVVWSCYFEEVQEYGKECKYFPRSNHYLTEEQMTSIVSKLNERKPVSIWVPLTVSIVLFLVWLILPIVAVFTPSSDTIYKMGASVVGEQLIQLEEVQEIGGEVGSLANDTIEMLRSHIQNATVTEE